MRTIIVLVLPKEELVLIVAGVQIVIINSIIKQNKIQIINKKLDASVTKHFVIKDIVSASQQDKNVGLLANV